MRSPIGLGACFRIGLLLLALGFQGCEEKVAGTSTSVDNPKVVLSFQGPTGSARVTGRLEVYSKAHNPLIDSVPLLSLAVDGRDSIEFLPERIGGPATFNLILRTDIGAGAALLGWEYRPGEKRLLLGGSPAPERVEMEIRVMGGYRARLEPDTVLGMLRYAYLPGTPYQAEIRDDAFHLDGVPSGPFALRFVTSQGYVFEGGDSLRMPDGQVFRPEPLPLDRVNVDPYSWGPDSGLQVFAGAAQKVTLQRGDVDFQGRVKAVGRNLEGLELSWTRLAGPPATLEDSTGMRTRIRFGAIGEYEFELKARLGGDSAADTTFLHVYDEKGGIGF